MTFTNLNIVELNDDKRQSQYDAIKKWVNDSMQILLHQGTEIEGKNETHITMITGLIEGNSNRHGSTEQNKWSNGNRNQQKSTDQQIKGSVFQLE